MSKIPSGPTVASDSAVKTAGFDDAIDLVFGPVAFAANRHLIEHMIRVQRELEIDFDTLVIWGTLAHLNVAHMLPHGKASALIELKTGSKNSQTEMRPLRLRDLEQVTGLPRETIRRKLAKLLAKGYIEQNPNGWIIKRDAIDSKMREFTKVTVLRLLDTAKHIQTMLEHPPKK